MRHRILLTCVLSASLLATGCSALKVSTAEGGAGPVTVGVGDGSRPGVTEDADAEAIPEGMADVTVDLGPECPVAVEFAMGPGWDGTIGYDGYQLYTLGDDVLTTVNCYDSDGSAPEETVANARESTFGESGSRIEAEKLGDVSGGRYWTFHGILGPDEVRAISGTESMLYGAVAAVRVEGRQFKVSVEMVAKSDDDEATALFEQMLPTVRFGGERLTPPRAQQD